ncbi:hypothetical protein ACG94X_02480 [Acinetobacter sp. ULE_I010]|uniref:hypothetical protein n=1 Tax=Acinetobacter sp. ULE_I010 TaxID=3373065 RepID=UPI003AF51C7C
MSNYRDDIQETAIAGNSTFGRMKTLAVEIAKISSQLLTAILISHSDVAIAFDQVTDSRYQVVYETAKISDSILGNNAASQLIAESVEIKDQDLSHVKSRVLIEETALASVQILEATKAIITDSVKISDQISDKKHSQNIAGETFKAKDSVLDHALKNTQIEDSLSIRDSVNDGVSSLITETFGIIDQVVDKRSTHSLTSERAKITDSTYRVARDQWQDSLIANDTFTDKLNVSVLISDSLLILDELLQEQKIKESLIDSSFIQDSVSDHLIAQDLVSELMFAEDHVIDNYAASGFAWTANVDNWAMSRYQGYQFDDLSVINSVLYGVNSDGVHRLDVDAHVDGQVITGKLDLGKGQLVHPLGAYLEYELSGSAKKIEIGVSTTQSGTQQTYLYKLPSEQANQLTNGRVLFGRGLRGRHFAFEINISGEHGYVNDLNIDIASTKRRV